MQAQLEEFKNLMQHVGPEAKAGDVVKRGMPFQHVTDRGGVFRFAGQVDWQGLYSTTRGMEWPHVSGHDNQCFWRSLVHMLAGCERPEGALEPGALKQQ
eukprot:1304549-Amphidinium_carterae.1